MPIYEYQCQACGHQFETTQRITEDPLKECPNCHKPQLERLISATAFLLKGGGWYKDGYGSSNSKPRTDNQVADRLGKAINDDKKKTADAASESTAAPSSPESSSSSSSDSSSSSSSSSGSSGTTS